MDMYHFQRGNFHLGIRGRQPSVPNVGWPPCHSPRPVHSRVATVLQVTPPWQASWVTGAWSCPRRCQCPSLPRSREGWPECFEESAGVRPTKESHRCPGSPLQALRRQQTLRMRLRGRGTGAGVGSRARRVVQPSLAAGHWPRHCQLQQRRHRLNGLCRSHHYLARLH